MGREWKVLVGKLAHQKLEKKVRTGKGFQNECSPLNSNVTLGTSLMVDIQAVWD